MRAHLARIPEAWNEISSQIIGAAMEVHTRLGPGLAEKLYEAALAYELRVAGVRFELQVDVRVPYKDILLPEQRMDLLVEDLWVVELKAVEKVSDLHLSQLTSYLRAADKPLGLLVNFNTRSLKDGLFRRLNPRCSRLQQLVVTSATTQPSTELPLR